MYRLGFEHYLHDLRQIQRIKELAEKTDNLKSRQIIMDYVKCTSSNLEKLAEMLHEFAIESTFANYG